MPTRQNLSIELGYIEDAFEKAGELAGASGARIVRYKRAITLASLLQDVRRGGGAFGQGGHP